MNKAEENSILLKFKEAYKYFPEGIINQPDKPDFVVNGEKIIGIEITQVFKDQKPSSGSLIMAKGSFLKNLHDNLLSKLEEADFPNCIFSIHIKNEIYSNKLDAREISTYCFEDFISNKYVLNGNKIYQFINTGELPEIVEGYTISIFDGVPKIDYILTGSAIGLPLKNEDIQFILDKKENLKKSYSFCNEYWLVIKEGSGEADYFGISTIENSMLKTSFDKVFLLRQRNSELIELK